MISLQTFAHTVALSGRKNLRRSLSSQYANVNEVKTTRTAVIEFSSNINFKIVLSCTNMLPYLENFFKDFKITFNGSSFVICEAYHASSEIAVSTV